MNFDYIDESNYSNLAIGTAAVGLVGALASGLILKYCKGGHTPTQKKADNVSIPTLSHMNFETDSSCLGTKTAVLYMSISGNPTHLGHIWALKLAADELKNRGYNVTKAEISLAGDWYYQGKCARQGCVPLSITQRIHFLTKAIEAAYDMGMIENIDVTYCALEANDGKTNRDHPDVYAELRYNNPDSHVFFVAGEDLCRNMSNWRNKIEKAIILKRADENHKETPLPPKGPNDIRYFIETDSEYSGLSSTKIRTGEAKLTPEAVDLEYRQIVSSFNT